MKTINIRDLLVRLSAHEELAARSIHFTPSENVLSPLARLPFVLDAHSRYFLDDLRLFGSWSFHSGRELGGIEQEVLLPVLRQLSAAKFVNVRPISGLNCMTIAIAALCEAGEVVLSTPLEAGGHASTSTVARRLGIRLEPLPMRGPHDVDLERLAEVLARRRPALVYLDQSTFLFPVDPRPIRDLVDRLSPRTRIHYDSSHVNGLILGAALFNPLQSGAHSFGGSTHKTLPGPHKGFLATNEEVLAEQFQRTTDHFISHHHTASMVSLAITLLELRDCGGREYASLVVRNAKAFARALDARGAEVAASDRGFTGCHQVWIVPATAEVPMAALAERLWRCGLHVNNFSKLPGISCPALRLSLAEVTRCGALESDTDTLASILCDALGRECDEPSIRLRVEHLRSRLGRPRFCYDLAAVESLREQSPELERLCEILPALMM